MVALDTMVTFQVAGRGFFQDEARPVNVTFTTTASVPTQNRYNVHTRTHCNFINANWQITDINTPDTFGICQAGAMVETEVVAGFYQDYNLIGVMELGVNYHCETP